jgi:integrase
MTTRHQAGYVFAANGAFHVRYYVTQVVDGQLKRVQKSERLCSKGDGTKTARRLTAAVMERVNADSGGVAQVDVPVTEFWERTYLPHLERTTKASTLHGYKKLWGQHLALHLASFKLREYKTVDATRFLTSLAERGLGTRTIAHVRSLLSGLFRHALRTGLIETNPVRDAGSLTPARAAEPTHAYTLEECENIISALVTDVQAQLVFALACFLGLRPGEIAGLQWADVSDEWIHVRRSSWRGITGTTKTPESVASVPLIEPLKSLLAVWQLQAKSDWLFPSNRGDRPLNISQFAQRVIAPVLKAQNIAWHGLYAGRRGAATLLVQLTGNAVASQYVLRHKNIATTQAFYVKPVQTAAVYGLKLLESKLTERLEQRRLAAGTGTENTTGVSTSNGRSQ